MSTTEQRVAIVTGAARGIGAATAVRLAAEGRAVAVLDLDEAACKDTVEKITAAGGTALAVGCDVSDSAQVEAAVARVAAELGAPTILVNNAGVLRDNLLFKMSESDWDLVMNVHLKGAFLMAKAVQAHMVEAKFGRIVSLSSSSALGNRGQANYSAVKAGLQGFTKTLAKELGKFGVTANAVAPGFIVTEMTAQTAARVGMGFEEFQAAAATQIPVQRVGGPRTSPTPSPSSRATTRASSPVRSCTSPADRSTDPGRARDIMTVQDSGKVALITGASRGIGYGIAEALVARGDRVVITGRGEDALKEAVERLGADRAIGVAGKAHDEAHQATAVERAMETFGRVDFLINNAGTNPVFGPMAELDLNVARKVYETNVISALGFAQQTWKAWQKENGGAIVNIASVAGVSASPFIGAYGMSKAAMVNLTLQLAHEFAPVVEVNAIAPAVVKTKFAEALYEGREAEAAAAYPLGRLGVPEDIGGAAAFLTSAQSDWITGQTLVVDGGIFLNAGVA